MSDLFSYSLTLEPMKVDNILKLVFSNQAVVESKVQAICFEQSHNDCTRNLEIHIQ